MNTVYVFLEDLEVTAAAFVGMHLERRSSVARTGLFARSSEEAETIEADLAASTTLLSIENLKEGEMVRVGLGRWNPSNYIIGSKGLKTIHFGVRRLS